MGFSPSATAQRIAGNVRNASTGSPISGAVVSLMNARDSSLRRVLTDEAGHFTMVRVAGVTSAHIVRIGFQPRVIQIATGDTALNVDLTPLPPHLASIVTSEKRVCPVDGSNGRGLELWEQVRAALLASVVSRETRPPRLRLITFDRTITAATGRIAHHNTTTRDLVADRAYVAARTPAGFAVYGYMEEIAGERILYAPDEATLLHPTFIEHHCLQVRDGDAAHRGEIGIAFEPAVVDQDTIVDVRGVIWIDREKPQLRSLTFRFVGLEPAATRSGGEVYFSSVRDGVQLISSWTIRIALLQTYASEADAAHRALPRDSRRNVQLTGIREVGGEVAFARWPDGTTWTSNLPRITGEVQDANGAPLSTARVWVVDSPDTVTTDTLGRFVLPTMPTGAYTILASDSSLAAAGIASSAPALVLLGGDANTEVKMRLHPRVDVLERMCTGQRYTIGQGVVLGRVLDAEGNPAANARIELWRRIVNKNVELFREEVSGEAGEDGRFIICGTPREQLLRVRATKGDATAETLIQRSPDEVSVVMLAVRRPTSKENN